MCLADVLLSEVSPDNLDHAVVWRPEWEKAHVFSLTVEQIDECSMVDCVGFPGLGRDLGAIDLVGKGELTDVMHRSSQTDEARVKKGHIVCQLLDCVALRINSDEDRLNIVTRWVDEIDG